MRPRLLMNFALRCVRFYPGVNSRAELLTLAPGLRPELIAGCLSVLGKNFETIGNVFFISATKI